MPEDAARLFLDRIPLVIVPAGGAAAVRIATPGTLIDVAPTVLHLLGIEPARGFVGRSLLPEREGQAAQVSGEAVSRELTWTGSACWHRPSGGKRPPAECDELRARAREQIGISWLITRYDLSRRLMGRAAH